MANLSYAVLIDGGFVKYTLKRKRADPPINADTVRSFVDSIGKLPWLCGHRLHRVYFYDAKPLTKKVARPDGTVIDFAASKAHAISTQQHQTIARLPFVAMRFGELSDRGWKVPERILPGIKCSIAAGRAASAIQSQPVRGVQTNPIEANRRLASRPIR